MCYSSEAVGPEGLIAFPVVRRAVRVDSADNVGERSLPGSCGSPERHIVPLKLRANGRAPSETVKEKGPRVPFLLPIHSQPTVGYTKPADFQWKENFLLSKSVSVLLDG